VPIFLFHCCYTGPLEEGERLLAPLRNFATPVVNTLAPMPPEAMLGFLAGRDPAGNHYAYDTRFLAELTDEAIRQIVYYGTHRSAPTTAVVVYNFHGEARRPTLAHSAFPVRDMPYCVGMYAGWPASDDDTPHLAWLASFTQATEPYTTGVGPIGLSNVRGEAEVRAAYSGQYAKLQEVKARYDPDNLFCHNYNILPAGSR
jgi:hypothetical protein